MNALAFNRPDSTETSWTAVISYIVIAGVVSMLAGIGGVVVTPDSSGHSTS